MKALIAPLVVWTLSVACITYCLTTYNAESSRQRSTFYNALAGPEECAQFLDDVDDGKVRPESDPELYKFCADKESEFFKKAEIMLKDTGK